MQHARQLRVYVGDEASRRAVREVQARRLADERHAGEQRPEIADVDRVDVGDEKCTRSVVARPAQVADASDWQVGDDVAKGRGVAGPPACADVVDEVDSESRDGRDAVEEGSELGVVVERPPLEAGESLRGQG